MERSIEEPTGGGGNVTIDLCQYEVAVPLPEGETIRVHPCERRDDVVRRLLLLGATPRTLTTLLPDWAELIERVAHELAGP